MKASEQLNDYVEAQCLIIQNYNFDFDTIDQISPKSENL